VTIGIVVLLLGAYSARVLVKGRYVPERVKKEPGSCINTESERMSIILAGNRASSPFSLISET